MRSFYVRLCDVPIIGCSFNGQLTLSRETFHFHMPMFKLLIPIDIYINCREIVDLYKCSYLLFFDSVGVRTVNGATYKFCSLSDIHEIFETMKRSLL